MPQPSLLEQELKKLASSGHEEAVIVALQALQASVSDIRTPIGETDSLELRKAVQGVLQSAIDKLAKFRKII